MYFVTQIGLGGEAQRPRSSHYAANLKAWRPSNRGQEGARPAHEADARSNPGDPGAAQEAEPWPRTMAQGASINQQRS